MLSGPAIPLVSTRMQEPISSIVDKRLQLYLQQLLKFLGIRRQLLSVLARMPVQFSFAKMVGLEVDQEPFSVREP